MGGVISSLSLSLFLYSLAYTSSVLAAFFFRAFDYADRQSVRQTSAQAQQAPFSYHPHVLISAGLLIIFSFILILFEKNKNKIWRVVFLFPSSENFQFVFFFLFFF